MRFSQAQVRNALGISVETFRHWKRVLPPFAERKKYTPGDLLAAGVLQCLTEQCGIRVGHLSEISKTIVEICNAAAWASLEGKVLIVDAKKRVCVVARSTRWPSSQEIAIVCPLASIIVQIQEALSSKQTEAAQRHLHFPPIAVSDGRAQRRNL